ncbi:MULTISPECIES: two-component response regulator DpiA [Buttiauxella]|jgi:two-component system response regulator CitB|uniref:Transcriptional regulatory protein n=1 Tax=Buttiauxella ferragutiae ATCC 51602 TaxID=1354252 RepID=A0ABX2W2S6_9ENTR|nr:MULTISPECIES: two-component response regulator DpiA [Buttiauxella]AYN27159.1 two-component response regulator [Buttiauxella sp. 3AFRM03]OAT24851.1 CitB/DpiA family transcriptional regulator [Buttiauxella ferragutiae ATCC 51602]TDN51910.1 two-component system response regulator CitB [Buttiauxella sp. JUb87]UNK60257.1 two-component response regulator DpiA [Buttiauxella ferragutiae]
MTQPITILIVEDETALAEMHAEFIRQMPHCGQVWLAGNLAQTRMMIERFKPDLILLDNYLPDGRGITLLQELAQARFPGGVVFTTAASDMDTVSDAVRGGVFDYLVKPIAYERLEQTLERYQQRMQMLANSASASQRQIDDMFNAYARGEQKEVLPVGIDELTLEKVQLLFTDPEARHTAETVAEALKLSRTTARRYLEFCASRQQIMAEIVYGKVGRPQRTYRAL